MLTRLMESSIPSSYTQSLKGYGLDWDPTITDKIYDTIIFAMSDFLSMKKSKDVKMAVAIKDLKGNTKLAGIVAYHPNENADMPGNWSYELTFDDEDLKDCNVFLASDNEFQRMLTYSAASLHGMRFTDPMHIQTMVIVAVNCLISWLDVNAKENEEVELEMPGYFLAAVGVENGEKVMSITPDGEMKKKIKDDAALTQEAA